VLLIDPPPSMPLGPVAMQRLEWQEAYRLGFRRPQLLGIGL